MAQNTVFAQVVKLIPRNYFQSWVTQCHGDKGVRTLDCWTWFGSLLFGQLSGHDSIRALERVFSQGESLVKKLGFRAVCRSTLADANLRRIFLLVQFRFDPEAGLRFGGPDQFHDDIMTDERPSPPVHADVREKPVLDLIPLARPWRQMTNGHGNRRCVHTLLQLHLPADVPF